MTEREKFGETHLAQKGLTPDPFTPSVQVPLYEGEMGEGRLPLSKWRQGVRVINSRSGARLRLEVDGGYVGLKVVEDYMLSDSAMARFYFVANVDNQGYLTLNIRNKQLNNPEQRHPDIHPQVLLDETFRYYQSQGIVVNGITAYWEPQSDNYKTYVRLVHTGVLPLDAANQTWTGKQAQKRGFSAKKIEQQVGDFRVFFSK